MKPTLVRTGLGPPIHPLGHCTRAFAEFRHAARDEHIMSVSTGRVKMATQVSQEVQERTVHTLRLLGSRGRN